MKYIKWKIYKYIVNMYNMCKIWREVLLLTALNEEIMPTVHRCGLLQQLYPILIYVFFVVAFKDVFLINQLQNIFKGIV